MSKKLSLKEIIEKMHKYSPEENPETGDWNKCFKYCLMGAELGDGDCMANAAFCYEYGNGVEEDGNKAVYWAKEALKVGNKEGICHLARYYEKGYSLPENFVLAKKYYKMAAEKGSGEAFGNLGNMYADGRGSNINFKKAFFYWEKAYKMGVDWVAKYMCECYLYGKGVKKDIDKARKYYDEVTENDDFTDRLLTDLEIAEAEEELNVKFIKTKVTCEGMLLKMVENPSKKKKAAKPKELEKSEFVLPGREELTKYFNEEIIDFFKHQKAYEEMGIHSVPATLLYGPPGCGKTYAVNAVAKYLNMPVFEINSSTVGDTYIHGTSKKIAGMFTKARAAAPSVLIIDEFETYVGKRCSDDWKSKVEETDEFLRNIGPAVDDKVIIFAMTNMPEMIDPAILRKGRFDNQLEVGPASETEILAVLNHELSKTKAQKDLDLLPAAKQLKGKPLSDVGYLVKQAIRNAVRAGRTLVEQQDLDAVMVTLNKANTFVVPHRAIGFQTAV